MEIIEQYLSEKVLSVLDKKGRLTFNSQEQKAYLHIKNQVYDEMVPVYDHNTKVMYLQNEIRDIIDNYYQSYYELMEQTFKPYEEMDFQDVALAVAAGLQIYNLYAPAIFVLRRIMHTNIYNGTTPKPMGWNLPVCKFQVNYKYVMEFGTDTHGGMTYTYDDYIFPQEVFNILYKEMGILKKAEDRIAYNEWMLEAWHHKDIVFNQS